MTGKLKKSRPTRRDAEDAATLKHAGDPAHINEREDRLLGKLMPEAHGAVVTRGLLAEAGRRGDDRVTRLIPAEAALLKARGGSGTVNPLSGLLEYSTAGGGGGEGGDNGVGGPGNGSEGTGPGQSYGGMDVGGNTSFGNWTDDPSMGPRGREDSIGYGGGGGRSGQLGYRAYDPMTMPAVESLLAAPSFMPEGMSMKQYAPRDTLARLVQEYFKPSVKAPGRYGAPSAVGPGIMGTMAGFLAGQPMSAMMGIGAAMGRASSPATQAASAAEDAARSGHNSGGQQQSHNLNEIDARLQQASGPPAAETVGQAPPPGYTLNPAGQIVPLAGQSQGDDRAAWKDPAQNLLYDYIWRGRSGTGGLLG
jgi:hypothetical protein